MPDAEVAYREKVHRFSGPGCVLQIIGLPLLIFLPLGTILGIVLIWWGTTLGKRWVCGACRTRLEDEHGTICPACKAELRTYVQPEP